MDYLKFSLVILLSLEFICLVSSNPITSLFGKSEDKAEADDKTTVSTASTAKSGADVTTTAGPSSSCGGLKGFLHICDKTETTEPTKTVKTRSVSNDSDSDSDSDESKSDEDSDEDKNPSEVTATSTDVSKPTEGGIAKRQADGLDDSETSEAPESEDTPAVPEVLAPEELPLGFKKRQVDESDNSSESDSTEDESNRQRRDCRDGPEDAWKDCKK